MPKIYSTEQIIFKFNEKHKGIYEYPRFVYVSTREKAIITCPSHGDFQQSPNSHLAGHGCYHCGLGVLTQEQVISEFRKKHEDRYDYSKFIYVDGHTKGIIICPEHGEFYQNAAAHKNGQGCMDCRIDDLKLSWEQVLADFIKEHGDRYDYSKFSYVNGSTKGIVICRDHGEFLQSPCMHKSGQDCPECARAESKSTLEEVLIAFRAEHGSKFDYSKFIYVNSQTKGIIICPEHGEFLQTPNNHKRGRGCPSCKESRGERAISIFLDSCGFKYIKQKSFDGCRNINPLFFDFYLPDHNLCIEFDGQQHFESTTNWGGVEAFKNIQLRDSIKNQFCIDTNIRLLRIPYWDFDNIERILKEFTWIHTIKSVIV